MVYIQINPPFGDSLTSSSIQFVFAVLAWLNGALFSAHVRAAHTYVQSATRRKMRTKIKLPPHRHCPKLHNFLGHIFLTTVYLSFQSRNHENLDQRPLCSCRPPRNGEHPTGLGCLLLGTRQHGDECRLRRLLSERTDILHQRQWYDHLPVYLRRWSVLEL